MFPVLYTTQVNSFVISKAKNSAVCDLLIYFEFVLHIVMKIGHFLRFVLVLFSCNTFHFFCTFAISVPHHPAKKCNFIWLLTQ